MTHSPAHVAALIAIGTQTTLNGMDPVTGRDVASLLVPPDVDIVDPYEIGQTLGKVISRWRDAEPMHRVYRKAMPSAFDLVAQARGLKL